MTDLFHQQEVAIDEAKLVFFLSKVSVWDHFGIKKKLSKPCFFSIIMSFLNGIVTQVKVFFVFFCLFFQKRRLSFFLISVFLGCLTPDNNFNACAKKSLTKSTPLPKQIFCLKNKPSKFVVASKEKIELMWPEYGYFGHDTFSIQLEKENMPEDSLFYLNQGRLS